MNEFEDVLQTHLERLEAGEPLANCLEELPATEKQLLQLAALLREMPFPQATPAAVAQQRARLLAAVPKETAMKQESLPFWQLLFTSWPRTAVTIAIVGLIFVLSLYWLRPNAQPAAETGETVAEIAATKPTQLAENETAEMAQNAVEETAVSPTPTTISPAANDPTTQAFLPILESSPFIDAHTATIQEAVGLVEVQDKNGRWHQAKRGTTLQAGQRLRTYPLSKTKILFYDGSEATLSANSELSLDQLDAQKPADGFRTILMTQWLGESQHQVDFRNDGSSRYEVNTPNGSGVARGTVFQVIVAAQTQFLVREGRVDVTNQSSTVTVIAGHLTTIAPSQPPTPPQFIITGEGEVTANGLDWIIGGQTFATTNSTVIIGNPQIGDIAHVTGYRQPDGTMVAILITLLHRSPANQFQLSGDVTAIEAEVWVVAGKTIAITDETTIDGAIVLGDRVRVQGYILPDGTLAANSIERVTDDYPFTFVGIVAAIDSESWTVSDIEVTVDGDTAIADGIAVGDLAQVSGTILADGTWLATNISRITEEADFVLTGAVNSIEPWVAAGVGFTVDSFTQIDSGIEVESLVRVSGQVLADGTWLATSITLLDIAAPLQITFVGIVNTVDPWRVSGIDLSVDDKTVIEAGIVVGDQVKITAVILPNGTLLAQTITLISPDTHPTGCFTIATVIISSGNGAITLEGLPDITLDDQIAIEGELIPNAIVLITLCNHNDGTITIITIIVIYQAPPPPQPADNHDDDDNDGDGNENGGGKVTVCHKGRNTITIARAALNAHLGHGDQVGACP
ncbi:MAG: FecR domain-containing protein [Ardenticatenaceae bacterium]|nr:FecR domain-containing protein [Ardenticatenaceae bacterium]